MKKKCFPYGDTVKHWKDMRAGETCFVLTGRNQYIQTGLFWIFEGQEIPPPPPPPNFYRKQRMVTTFSGNNACPKFYRLTSKFLHILLGNI